MVVKIERRESLNTAVGHEIGVEEMVVCGEKLVVETPSHDEHDVTGARLNIEMTSEGTLRELKALEYLAVGDVIWEVRHGAFIRRRAVARDFAQSVSAAQLGISSPTSSAEALRMLCLARSKRQTNGHLDSFLVRRT